MVADSSSANVITKVARTEVRVCILVMASLIEETIKNNGSNQWYSRPTSAQRQDLMTASLSIVDLVVLSVERLSRNVY